MIHSIPVLHNTTGLFASGGDESDVDRVFKHFFSQENLFSAIPSPGWSPPTDVYETPDRYVIRVEIPGVDAKKVGIILNHNVLSIRGERRNRTTDTILGFQQMEIHYGRFEKVVTLPHSIEPGEIEPAHYADGFLCVTIRKAPPRRSNARRIQIES